MSSAVSVRRSPLLLLLLALFLPLLLSGRGAAGDGVPAGRYGYVPDRVLVAFHEGAPVPSRLGAVARLGLAVDSAEAASPHFARLAIPPAQFAAGMNVERALAQLRRDPSVRVAEPDYIVRRAAVPNDPYFDELWGLHNRGQGGGTADADIDAPEAWDITRGAGVVVAVIDTGVDYNHPDLNDNIFRDDTGKVIGRDFINNDADPMDDEGHGTHCAGTIAAEGNNGIGVTGVCQQAKIMPLKFLDGNGDGTTSGAIQAIDFARLNGAALTSNSWGGGGPSQLLFEAIQRTREAGMLFVAAAGNGGDDGIGDNNDVIPDYPAAYSTQLDNIVSVAALNRNDQLAGFSNYGAQTVQLGAPGVTILSTYPNNGYAYASGTSMAAPHVAGAAALLLSYAPGLSVADLKNRLLQNTDPVSALNGKAVTAGRLNVHRALPSAPVYRVTGTVTAGGSGLSGVTVTIGTKTATTAADGTYTVTGVEGGSYTVTPARAGYVFTPASRSITVSADVSGVDFTGAVGSKSIGGRITLNGTGLSGITVNIGAGSATTAADGRYVLDGLADGTYVVQPTSTRYTFNPTSRSITLGSSRNDVDFTATEVTYTVSGTVTAGGVGLGGVTVSAGGSSATTAADGSYSIAGLVGGTYTVVPAKTGYKFSPANRSVTLSANTAGIDFSASPVFSISGKVTEGTSGLSGVTITAGDRTATTNVTGSYTLRDLPAGDYTVTASLSGKTFLPASRSVTLGPDAANVSFSVAPPDMFVISGRILENGAGLQGVTVRAGSASGVSAADGTFSITGVSAGTFTVTPELAEYDFSPASRSVTVGPSQDGLEFTAAVRTYTISGTVRDGKNGLSGATVTAGTHTATTGADGTYRLEGVRAGSYTVKAEKDGYEFEPSSRSVSVGPSRTGIDFAGSAPLMLLEIRLQKGATKPNKKVKATVVFNQPLPKAATVRLTSSDGKLAKVPGKVKVKKGKSSATFVIQVGKSKKAKKGGVVTITATHAKVVRSAELTISP
ncbi:MAG: S8 family serine peptidase [Armatimonadota bacterium]